MVDALLREAELIVEEGIDARLAAADANAEAIAAAPARSCCRCRASMSTTAERIERIREIAE